MDNFISTTGQTKIRVAQDGLRSPLVSAKGKRGLQAVIDSWAEKARTAGFDTLRAWVDASQTAGHRPAPMLAPRWD